MAAARAEVRHHPAGPRQGVRQHLSAGRRSRLLFPWFYHPLKREPRKSGFLLPSPGHNSLRGFYLGAGYFWAINRSYDADLSRRRSSTPGLVSHHAEFRGTPRQGTDFDLVLFGSATSQTNSPSGLTAYGVAEIAIGQRLDRQRHPQLHHHPALSARTGRNPTTKPSARRYTPRLTSTRVGPPTRSTWWHRAPRCFRTWSRRSQSTPATPAWRRPTR